MTLPVIAVGSESNLEVDFNLGNDASIGVHWGGLAKSERLTDSELKDNPGSSLMLDGQELGFIFQRFSSGVDMSGIHWGLGAGYRSLNAVWAKSSTLDPQLGLAAREGALTTSRFRLNGAILNARFGYRYVGSSVGLVAGIYLRARHFQSKLSDKASGDDGSSSAVPLSLDDKIKVKRRLMTSILPTLELGWAF